MSRGPKARTDGRESRIIRIVARKYEADLIRDRLSPDQRRQVLLAYIVANEVTQAGHRRGRNKDGRPSRIMRIAANKHEADLIRDRLSPSQRRVAILAWIAEQHKIVNHDDAVLISLPQGRNKLLKS